MATGGLTDALRETLAVFDGSGTPRTTSEVATDLAIGRRSTYDRLERLVDRNRLRTKKVGASARVWWRPASPEARSAVVGTDHHRSVVDAIEEYAVVELDGDGRIRRWNTGAKEIVGYDPSAVIGDHVSVLYPPTARTDDVPETNLATAAREGSYRDEEWWVRADGTRFWADVTISVVRDDDKSVAGYVSVIRDVTDQQDRKRQLDRERDLTDRILETAPIRLAVFAPDGSIERMDSLSRQKLGLEEVDLSEVAHQDLPLMDSEGNPLDPADHPAKTVVETEESVSDSIVLHEEPDGSVHWFSVTASPLFDADGELERVVVAAKDVTDLKRTERQLSRQRDTLEGELDDVFDRIDDGVIGLDNDWQCTYVNERAASLLHVSREAALGRSLREFLPGEIDETFETRARSATERQEPTTFESYYSPRDIWFEVTVYPSDTGVSLYFQDVSQRKEHERNLERFERAVEASGHPIYMTDADGEITYVNSSFEATTGYGAAEAIGQTPEELDQGPDVPSIKAAIGEDAVWEDEVVCTRKNGEYYYAERTIAAVNVDRGSVDRFVVVQKDVTDRRQFEERLTALNEASRDLLTAGSTQEVRNVVVEVATRDFDLPCAALYGYDENGDLLLPVAQSVEDDFLPMDFPSIPPDDDSLTGHAFSTGTPQHYGDVTESPHMRLDPDETEMRTASCVPLGDNGIIVAGDREIDAFDENARRLLELLAANADAAWTRVHREAELETRIRQQEVVTDLGQRALEEPDIDALMAEIADLAATTVGTEFSKVLDLDEDRGILSLRQGVGWETGSAGEVTVPADAANSPAAYALATDEPIVVRNMGEETRFQGSDILTSHDVESGISTIVGPVGDPWGVLAVHHDDPVAFSEQDVNFVQSVATILAGAIQRHDHEQELVRQREEITAMNNLNETVREITHAVIEQSTREEIEETVCEHLAATDSYQLAWIGDVDVDTQTVNNRFEAGVEGYLEETTISIDPDDVRSHGPAGTALRTGTIQTLQNVEDPRFDPWREKANQYGFSSSAAIPIVHEDTTYGILCVYTRRANAFQEDERAVVKQLGEVVGHAIAATERKRALMSDEVVELEYQVPDVLSVMDVDVSMEGTISLDHAIPIEEDSFLVYGRATPDAVGTVTVLQEQRDHWIDVLFRGATDEGEADGYHRFELILSDPPVLSNLTDLGGFVEQTSMEDGNLRISIQVPPTVDVRKVTQSITETYPTAKLLKRQQTTRVTRTTHRVDRVFESELTDRQRVALEAAQYAGFFEWPRDATGEEVAESLGISAPTFYQHLRKAEAKVFDSLITDRAPTS